MPTRIEMQLSDASQPAELDPAGWRPLVALARVPRTHPGLAGDLAWYRIVFDLSARAPGSETAALYVPFLYDGGRWLLNGAPLATIAQGDADTHVRWERPHLIALPEQGLRAGANELLLHAHRTDPGSGAALAGLRIGATAAMLQRAETRLFWVRTMPQATVATCMVVGLFVLSIWLRRRDEVLYGLFGLACVLWSVRTLTFVIETLPQAAWPWWRMLYHASTGGFIIVLALFALRYAGLSWPRVERALVGYWALGPLALLATRGGADARVGLWWTGGMIPVGLAIVALCGLAAWRRRSATALALLAAVLLATLAGVHDYIVAWDGARHAPDWLRPWMQQRIFLLHHGANLMLLVMGAILTLRFVDAIDRAESLNRRLEERVREREGQLLAQHASMARLAREQAAGEERERIMQELHDGLGSQLFTSLSRIERGTLDAAGLAQVLRECIAEMRLAFDVTAPAGASLAEVLGDFLFRWRMLLHDAGVKLQTRLAIEPPLVLAPATSLQLLRILQEALTNVLKHAGARAVQLEVERVDDALAVTVHDDGCNGAARQSDAPAPERGGGRGLVNMARRAQALGAQLDFTSTPNGTRVHLRVPLRGAVAHELRAQGGLAAAPDGHGGG